MLIGRRLALCNTNLFSANRDKMLNDLLRRQCEFLVYLCWVQIKCTGPYLDMMAQTGIPIDRFLVGQSLLIVTIVYYRVVIKCLLINFRFRCVLLFFFHPFFFFPVKKITEIAQAYLIELNFKVFSSFLFHCTPGINLQQEGRIRRQVCLLDYPVNPKPFACRYSAALEKKSFLGSFKRFP